MFKKLFRTLTQSPEERYLDELENSAVEMTNHGAEQQAGILRRFAVLKRDIDRRLESRDTSMLQIDELADRAQKICNGARARLDTMVKLESRLAEVVTSRDVSRLSLHIQQWSEGHQSLLRAYAVLHHAATGESPTNLDTLTTDGKQTELDDAVERLLVEIRTAERIRYELGG